jgi:hypothetical protein
MKKKFPSPTGNWTPVSRVTGGDTDHYTIEDLIIAKYTLQVSKYLQNMEHQAVITYLKDFIYSQNAGWFLFIKFQQSMDGHQLQRQFIHQISLFGNIIP